MYFNILMLSLISFFTKIPMKGDLEKASKETFLLPLVALIIALPPAIFYYYFSFLPLLIRSLIGIFIIYVMTGLIHLDGLADFSDGIMAKGSRERKIKALKDTNTGIAALFSVLMIILIEIISLYSLKPSTINIFEFFIISELSAKYSMIGGLLNKPSDEGLGALFQRNFKKYYLLISIVITIPFYLIFKIYYFISFIGFLISLILSILSKINFGMVNGDALGAMNEISRGITMVILCLV